VVDKGALAVGATIEVRTPNTAELAKVLLPETVRQDLCEPWLRRLRKFARSALSWFERSLRLLL
jgi:hypothetical protein